MLRELYRNIDSKDLSLQDRQMSPSNNPSLTYGEVVPQSFIQILEASVVGDQLTFVDLGCGSGVALFTTALSASATKFDRVWGIEILPQLWTAACQLKDKLIHLREVALNPPQRLDTTQTALSIQSGASVLLEKAVLICQKLDSESFKPIEELVSDICKDLGHKEYRKMLKGHKTFKKLLIAYPDMFDIADDSVRLKQETGEVCGASISSEAICEEARQDYSDAEASTVAPSVSCKEGTPRLKIVADENSTKLAEEKSADVSREGGCVDETVATSSRKAADDAIVSLLKSEGGRDFLNGHVPEITIERGDIFEIDWWTSADIVYCASLLFSDDMMVLLSERASRMKPGSVFITLKPLVAEHLNHFELISDSFYKMSWQMARVYMYKVVRIERI